MGENKVNNECSEELIEIPGFLGEDNLILIPTPLEENSESLISIPTSLSQSQEDPIVTPVYLNQVPETSIAVPAFLGEEGESASTFAVVNPCKLGVQTCADISCQDGGACQYACQDCQVCEICQNCLGNPCENACQGCEGAVCEVKCQNCEGNPCLICLTCQTCQTDCELCENCQGAGCQDKCQINTCQVCEICQNCLGNPCENACQGCEGAVCQINCQDTCELSCQNCLGIPCQDSCLAAVCETACQSLCQISCQTTCELGCQSLCELGCQNCLGVPCQDSCLDPCQNGCQSVCELNTQITTASYTINHYTQKLNSTSYELYYYSTGSGEVGATATAYALSITGFTPQNSSVSGTIISDGSLVLNLYYSRNKYTITFMNEGKVFHSQDYYYEAMPVAPSTTPTKEASSDGTKVYLFNKWTPDFVKVTGKATYTAAYTDVPQFVWTYAGADKETGDPVPGINKESGLRIYVTADEWNTLVKLVNESGVTLESASVSKGDKISASVVNLVATAVQVETVTQKTRITAAFFNLLREKANDLRLAFEKRKKEQSK